MTHADIGVITRLSTTGLANVPVRWALVAAYQLFMGVGCGLSALQGLRAGSAAMANCGCSWINSLEVLFAGRAAEASRHGRDFATIACIMVDDRCD